MKGSLVVRVVVHALDDVDLAVIRPIGANGPERGPRPTTGGHVNTVHDNEPASERKLRLHPHGSAVSGHLWRGVDSHDGIASAIDRCQVALLLERIRVMRCASDGRTIDRLHAPLSARRQTAQAHVLDQGR